MGYANATQTPHGPAGCQFCTGPHIMGAFSLRGVNTESELNAQTLRTALGLVQVEID